MASQKWPVTFEDIQDGVGTWEIYAEGAVYSGKKQMIGEMQYNGIIFLIDKKFELSVVEQLRKHFPNRAYEFIY